MNLHFLHGFLGLPSDWNLFNSSFLDHKKHFHSIYDTFHTDMDLKEWAEAFNQSIFHSFPNSKNILIGYSLGGRLALHSLLTGHWDGAIIISTHPGLINSEDKEQRYKTDLMWSQRFLNDPWDVVLKDWNSQSVFSQDNLLHRKEVDYNRQTLSNIMLNFSLSQQENLRVHLKNLKIPVLWLSGVKDPKFTNLMHEIKDLNPFIQTKIIDAGHRIPWENPKQFTSEVNQFLHTL